MSVSPVGYIEVREVTARFQPIFTPDTILKMQIIGGLIALGMIRGFRLLFGHRPVKKGEKGRGPIFNVVFSPHANIIARVGRALNNHAIMLVLLAHACTLCRIVPTRKIKLSSISWEAVLVTPAPGFHQSMLQWHPALAEQHPRRSSHVSCNQEALEP
jgi:hypothetical protein